MWGYGWGYWAWGFWAWALSAFLVFLLVYRWASPVTRHWRKRLPERGGMLAFPLIHLRPGKHGEHKPHRPWRHAA